MPFDLEYIDEEADELLAVTKQRPSSPRDTESPCDHVTNQPVPEAVCNSPSNDFYQGDDLFDDRVILSQDVVESEHAAVGTVDSGCVGEDFELQAMFYLPKWAAAFPPSTAKLRARREESLKVLLGNVAELLSRSPPPLNEDLEVDVVASPPLSSRFPHQPFQVSFTLNVDDDDDDDGNDNEVMMMMMNNEDNNAPKTDCEELAVGNGDIHRDWPQPDVGCPRTAAESPTWDEVFGEEEVNNNQDERENSKEADVEKEVTKSNTRDEGVGCWDDERNEEMPDMTEEDDKEIMDPMTDNSMDLFEDDEAFLQMTIPDISTPAVTPKASLGAEDDTAAMKNMPSPSPVLTAENQRSITEPAESKHRLATTHTDDLSLANPIKCHPPHARPKPQEKKSPTTTETQQNAHTAAASEPASVVTAHKSSVEQQSWRSFDSSDDFFSVNFDLGYSLDNSEEEWEQDEGPVPSTSASPLSKKLPVADSSTPLNSFQRARQPLESSEPKLSTPQTQWDHRTENAHLLESPVSSPIALPGARRTISTPSLPPGVKRRRLEGRRTSEFEGSMCERSVCGTSSRPHPGWFNRQEISFRNLILPNFSCIYFPVCHLFQWSPTVTARRRLWFINEGSRIRSTHYLLRKW